MDDYSSDEEGAAKRRRGDPTAALIHSVLQEEQQRKKAKKGGQVGAKKTVQEMEAEAGGPVKESLVSIAHNKRALSRKKKGASEEDDTELVAEGELARYEEQGPGEGDDDDDEERVHRGGEEATLEPFNLTTEREEGFFDDTGNYVLNKDAIRKDAWLESTGGDVVGEAVLQAIAARERAREAAEAAPEISENQLATIKRQVAGMLQPRETVVAALKRLAGRGGAQKKALSKRERQKLAAAAAEADAAGGGVGGSSAGDQEAFRSLTEMAGILLNSGELDAYSSTKEAFEADAAAVLGRVPQSQLLPQGLPAAAVVAVDADDDMFGDDDDAPGGANNVKEQEKEEVLAKEAQGTHGGRGPGAGPEPVQPPAPEPAAGTRSSDPAVPDSSAPASASTSTAGGAAATSGGAGAGEGEGGAVDYASWPVKELRRFLQERNQDVSNIVEKADLVERVKAAASEGPDGLMQAPPGYQLDPSGSGYYYSQEAGMYWDPTYNLYCSGESGAWFTFDAALGHFVSCASAPAEQPGA